MSQSIPGESNDGVFRELTKCFLVVWSGGPVLLTTNSAKAVECFKKCKERDSKSFMINFTTHVERLKEIGKNLFMPIPASCGENLIGYRNNIIKEWQDTVDMIPNANPSIVWNKIAIKHKITHGSAAAFNQWAMDHMKYHKKMI